MKEFYLTIDQTAQALSDYLHAHELLDHETTRVRCRLPASTNVVTWTQSKKPGIFDWCAWTGTLDPCMSSEVGRRST